MDHYRTGRYPLDHRRIGHLADRPVRFLVHQIRPRQAAIPNSAGRRSLTARSNPGGGDRATSARHRPDQVNRQPADHCLAEQRSQRRHCLGLADRYSTEQTNYRRHRLGQADRRSTEQTSHRRYRPDQADHHSAQRVHRLAESAGQRAGSFPLVSVSKSGLALS